MANYKKPGRPPKKRDWKQEQRFNWTIDFFKFPAAHTFIHLNGIEAVLPEFERFLSESGNAASSKELHVQLLNAKTAHSFGQMPTNQTLAHIPTVTIKEDAGVAPSPGTNTFVHVSAPLSAKSPLTDLVPAVGIIPSSEVVISRPKRASILDD